MLPLHVSAEPACVTCVCAFKYSCLLLLAVPDWVHNGSQAFINTARKIYEKIEQGVFDVSNEVCENEAILQYLHWITFSDSWCLTCPALTLTCK